MAKFAPLWWKIFWVIFALTLTIYLVMVVWSLPKLAEMAGGQPMFDLRPFGYGLEEAKDILSRLGAEGQEFYLFVQQRLDTAFPALLAITMVMALIGLDRGGWGWIFCVFAISGTIFDYLENKSVREMLEAGHSGLTQEIVEQASSWTLLKSISHTIAYIGLTILIFIAFFHWIKSRRAKPSNTNTEEAQAKVTDE